MPSGGTEGSAATDCSDGVDGSLTRPACHAGALADPVAAPASGVDPRDTAMGRSRFLGTSAVRSATHAVTASAVVSSAHRTGVPAASGEAADAAGGRLAAFPTTRPLDETPDREVDRP
jgi:hypothetical protein